MKKPNSKKKTIRKPDSKWGGARPGTGPKFIEGEKRSEHVQFNITETDYNQALDIAQRRKLTGINLVNALARKSLKDLMKRSK